MEFDKHWRVLPPPNNVPYGAPSRGEEQAYLSRLHAMVRHNGHRPRTDWPVDRILNSLPQSLRAAVLKKNGTGNYELDAARADRIRLARPPSEYYRTHKPIAKTILSRLEGTRHG